MTIKTATYIHNLLKKRVELKELILNNAREQVYNADLEDSPDIVMCEEHHKNCLKEYHEAFAALEDFENSVY